MLIVDCVATPLGSPPDGSVAVVVDEDIKLPTRTAVSDRARLVTEGKIEKGVFQLIPIEEDNPEENKVTLCETVVKAAEVVTIMLINQAHKTIKIRKREEVGRALSLRSIQQVKFDKERKRGSKQVGEIRDKEIVATDKFRARIGRLLRANCDVVAKSDKGQTCTVKM